VDASDNAFPSELITISGERRLHQDAGEGPRRVDDSCARTIFAECKRNSLPFSHKEEDPAYRKKLVRLGRARRRTRFRASLKQRPNGGPTPLIQAHEGESQTSFNNTESAGGETERWRRNEIPQSKPKQYIRAEYTDGDKSTMPTCENFNSEFTEEARTELPRNETRKTKSEQSKTHTKTGKLDRQGAYFMKDTRRRPLQALANGGRSYATFCSGPRRHRRSQNNHELPLNSSHCGWRAAWRRRRKFDPRDRPN